MTDHDLKKLIHKLWMAVMTQIRNQTVYGKHNRN